MGVPMKLATFGLALVVVLIAALEIGYRLRPAADAATSPSGSPSTGSAEHGGSEHGGSEHGGSEHGGSEHGGSEQGGTEPRSTAPSDTPTAESGQDVSGLAATVDGYTLTLLTPRPSAAERTTIRFLITGPDQQPVTAYDTAHGKQLHLIVVRRDLASFQHVHPVLDSATGVWTTTIDTAQAGTYRVFADTVPSGHDGLTLGADLAVAGAFDPAPPAAEESRTAEVDGYRVELIGSVRAGQTGALTATVSRGGRPVTDLDPYLEAYGHLVALRQSDLAYLHVHPDGHPGDGTTAAGPTIDFMVQVPSTGTYRLFLDFSHDGVVRTAPFVVTVR